MDPSTTSKEKNALKLKNKSNSKRAGITFPGRIKRYLKKGQYESRISNTAAVYKAAVLEYLAAEILELAGGMCAANSRSRITPRHILLAVQHDEELSKLLSHVIIPEGGVGPHIQPVLLPKQTTERIRKDNRSANSENMSSQKY